MNAGELVLYVGGGFGVALYCVGGDQTMSVLRTSSRSARNWWAAAVVAASLLLVCPAQADDIKRAGPWAFTERINENTHAREQIALTPAAEDTDIWLLLACSQSRFTASLMDNAGFSYAIGALATLILRTDDFPVISVTAKSIQQNQLSIDAATSRHIMPMLYHSERIVVLINDAETSSHEYTFSLQPNDQSLARIVRDCWTDN